MPKSRKAITLWNFLHGAINEKVVVDLKDESVIEGVIEAADPSLNLHLSEATFYRRRIEGVKPEKLTHTRIQGKHIRFIHFRTDFNMMSNCRSLLFYLFLLLILNGALAVDKNYSSLQAFEYISPQIRRLKPDNNVKRLLLSFTAFGNSYSMVLRSSHIPVESNFKLMGQNGSMDRSEVLYETDFYSGHVEGHPFSRIFISVHNSDSTNLNGFIELENDTLILEPVTDSNLTLIYKSSDVKIDRQHSVGAVDYGNITQAHGDSLIPQKYFEQFMKKKRQADEYEFEYIQKNRCELKLVADYEFFRVIGHGNYAQSARYLINLIERVNSIFTKVEWGINEQNRRLSNLGFSIKEIKIYEEPNRNRRHFNSNYSVGTSISVNDMLTSFAHEEGSLAFCAVVLISAKLFDYGVLGRASVAYFPFDQPFGLCASGGSYQNTGVMTIRNDAGLLITRLVDLVVAHELGHLWGARHDDESDEECVPKNTQNGRYIMFASSNSGYDRNNYQFSKCSIRQIHKVLYTLAEKCFKEEQRALCGNGILEAGEQCDAGGKLTTGVDRTKRDPCCTGDCQLRENAVCSPRHSDCCSSNCTYSSAYQKCRPKNTDTCRKESFCTGKNATCPEPLPLEDETVCVEEGKCRGGECIPFCQLIDPNFKPCICEKVGESCLRCCKDGENGTCKPNMPNNQTRFLPEGSICIHGHCRNNVCEKEVTDLVSHLWNILKNFNRTPKSKLFTDYFGFIIIVTSLFIWVPCCYFVDRQDRKRARERQQQAMRPPENILTVVPLKKTIRRFQPNN